jgi:hypothetical protein
VDIEGEYSPDIRASDVAGKRLGSTAGDRGGRRGDADQRIQPVPAGSTGEGSPRDLSDVLLPKLAASSKVELDPACSLSNSDIRAGRPKSE